MIEPFVRALETAGLDAHTDDVRDALWLAVTLPFEASRAAMTLDALSVPRLSTAPNSSPSQPAPPHSSANEPVVPNKPEVYPPRQAKGTGTPRPVPAISISTPAGRALPHALSLARAMRPLKRRAPSRTSFVTDEEATAEALAEQELLRRMAADLPNGLVLPNALCWEPVRHPAPRRWLDVVLLVDGAPGMAVWEETVREFQVLLEGLGAFRQVQRWRLETSSDNVRLQGPGSGIGKGGRKWRELLDPTGERLLLVVSDCLAPAWRRGGVSRLLSRWAENGSVTLVQMLPDDLWHRTALGPMEAWISSPIPAPANSGLRAAPHVLPKEPETCLRNTGGTNWEGNRTWKATGKGYPYPVVTLEAEALSEWASMIAGDSRVQVPGVLLPEAVSARTEKWERDIPGILSPLGGTQGDPDLSVQELYRQFRSASPLAQRLGAYLASVPLTLPVIRLVQQALLPTSRQVHLAELFMSGLVRRAGGGNAVSADGQPFEFIAGARDMLLTGVRISETVKVIRTVSEFIKRQAGQPTDTPAMLADPTGTESLLIDERTLPFAELAAETLERLGVHSERAAMLRGKIAHYQESGPTPGLIPLATIKYHDQHFKTPVWALKEAIVATTLQSGAVLLANAENAWRHSMVKPDKSRALEVAWFNSGRSIAVLLETGAVQFFDSQLRPMNGGFDSSFRTHAIHGLTRSGIPNELLVYSSKDSGVSIIRGFLGTGISMENIPFQGVADFIDSSKDGTVLAFAARKGQAATCLIQWLEVGRQTIGARERVRYFSGVLIETTSLSCSPDGTLIAIGGCDGRIVLWNIGRILPNRHRYRGDFRDLAHLLAKHQDWATVEGRHRFLMNVLSKHFYAFEFVNSLVLDGSPTEVASRTISRMIDAFEEGHPLLLQLIMRLKEEITDAGNAEYLKSLLEDLRNESAFTINAVNIGTADSSQGPYQLPDQPDVVILEKELAPVILQGITDRHYCGIGIIGLRGSGRTSFLLELAHQLKAYYPDGQICIDMAYCAGGVNDVMQHVVKTFTRRTNADITSNHDSVYRETLYGRRVIIVVDNADANVGIHRLIPPEGSLLLVVLSDLNWPRSLPLLPIDLGIRSQRVEWINDIISNVARRRNPSTGTWRDLAPHGGPVSSLSFSADGRLLASKSTDGTVRLWDTETWQVVGMIDEPSSGSTDAGLAFHPTLPLLATLGEKDTVVRIWGVDTEVLLRPLLPPDVEATEPASIQRIDLPVRHRFALLIGTDLRAEGRQPEFHYAVSDAFELGAVLHQVGYDPEHTVVLADDQATRLNILAALDRLARAAGPEDLLWIHFSGYGQLVNGEPALFAYDSFQDLLSATALPVRSLLDAGDPEGRPRVLLTLDAGLDPFLERVTEMVQTRRNVTFLGCGEEEDPDLQQGVLSHCLIEALHGFLRESGAETFSLVALRSEVERRLARVTTARSRQSLRSPLWTAANPVSDWEVAVQSKPALTPIAGGAPIHLVGTSRSATHCVWLKATHSDGWMGYLGVTAAHAFNSAAIGDFIATRVDGPVIAQIAVIHPLVGGSPALGFCAYRSVTEGIAVSGIVGDLQISNAFIGEALLKGARPDSVMTISVVQDCDVYHGLFTGLRSVLNERAGNNSPIASDVLIFDIDGELRKLAAGAPILTEGSGGSNRLLGMVLAIAGRGGKVLGIPIERILHQLVRDGYRFPELMPDDIDHIRQFVLLPVELRDAALALWAEGDPHVLLVDGSNESALMLVPLYLRYAFESHGSAGIAQVDLESIRDPSIIGIATDLALQLGLSPASIPNLGDLDPQVHLSMLVEWLVEGIKSSGRTWLFVFHRVGRRWPDWTVPDFLARVAAVAMEGTHPLRVAITQTEGLFTLDAAKVIQIELSAPGPAEIALALRESCARAWVVLEDAVIAEAVKVIVDEVERHGTREFRVLAQALERIVQQVLDAAQGDDEKGA